MKNIKYYDEHIREGLFSKKKEKYYPDQTKTLETREESGKIGNAILKL